MKIRYIKSATVCVESNGVKILTDPWLVDGEYYGAWFHYPPLEFDEQYFAQIDYIYVSHIHPDHFSKATFAKLNKGIPVLIHCYESKFLKNNIERLGFNVIELNHNVRTHLKNGVYINILAADNCNPEVCAKFFGCGIAEAKYGSTQIDSISVIDDGVSVVVNTNDCPYELSRESVSLIKKEYKAIDMLLVGYGGAGPYPQCFRLDEDDKLTAADNKKKRFLDFGLRYIQDLNPSFVLPFAGTYVLGGKLARLQEYRGVPEIEEAALYYSGLVESRIVLLNSYQSFDTINKKNSAEYEPTDLKEKKKYINRILSKRKLEYEQGDEKIYFETHREEIFELIETAYQRFELKRTEIGFQSQTDTFLFLTDNLWCKISNRGEGISFVDDFAKCQSKRYVSYKLDVRLLHKILKGPRFAHWNNAEIGSHIEFDRMPDHFERGLHYAMNYFHQ
jgi:UDP-MurNAc hydroxylase